MRILTYSNIIAVESDSAAILYLVRVSVRNTALISAGFAIVLTEMFPSFLHYLQANAGTQLQNWTAVPHSKSLYTHALCDKIASFLKRHHFFNGNGFIHLGELLDPLNRRRKLFCNLQMQSVYCSWCKIENSSVKRASILFMLILNFVKLVQNV
jgi:hypothetical protein